MMKGIVAIFICKLGHIIATVADFDKDRFGGFSQQESQKVRAKQALIGKTIREYCSPNLSDNLDNYTMQRMFEDLIKNGAKVHYEEIGYDD